MGFDYSEQNPYAGEPINQVLSNKTANSTKLEWNKPKEWTIAFGSIDKKELKLIIRNWNILSAFNLIIALHDIDPGTDPKPGNLPKIEGTVR